MNGNFVFDKQYNIKGAARCMCGVGFTMLFSKILSDCAAIGYSFVITNFQPQLSGALAAFLRLISGCSGTVSLAAARNILLSNELMTFISMIMTVFTLVLPAYVFSKSQGNSISDCFETKGSLCPCFFGVYFAASLFMAACSSLGDLFYGFLLPDAAQSAGAGSAIVQGNGTTGLVIELLCTVIMVPIIEEYFFRGAVFTALSRYGTDFAVIASSFCFGAMHFEAGQSLYAFAFGIFASMTVVITGNIKTAIIFHTLNNLSVFIMQNLKDVSSGIYSDSVMILTSILGIWGIFQMFKKDGVLQAYKDKKHENDMQNGIPEDKCGLSQLFVIPILLFLALYASYVFIWV